jgi:hypothetical protein
MNTILMFFIQLVLTFVVCFFLTAYLRPVFKRVLVDLCKTEARAQFWTTLSNILLITLPVVLAMGYQPLPLQAGRVFFDVAGQLRWNLLGYIAALIIIGGIVSFFALVAPRPRDN